MASVDPKLLEELGAEPVEETPNQSTEPQKEVSSDLLKELGAEVVEPTAEVGTEPSGMDLVGQALKTTYPGLAGIADIPGVEPVAEEFGKQLFSATEGVVNNPAMQTLDPATKLGIVTANTIQGMFDKGGEVVAEHLAAAGVNPYISAAAGTIVARAPDIAFSIEGIAAIRAAGNARAEAAMLDKILMRERPQLTYQPELGRQTEVPTTLLKGGETAIELGPKVEKPLLLGASKQVEGEGFVMSEAPDLAKIQGQRLSIPTQGDDVPLDTLNSIKERTEHYTLADVMYDNDEIEIRDMFKYLPARFKQNPDDMVWLISSPDTGMEGDFEITRLIEKHFGTSLNKELLGKQLHEYATAKINDISVWVQRVKGGLGSKAYNQYVISKDDIGKLVDLEIESRLSRQFSGKGVGLVERFPTDVSSFDTIPEKVAPADRMNPAVTELVDESRAQFSGEPTRLKIFRDPETGRAAFKLANDPMFEKHVASDVETASAQTTKNSPVVKELGLDARIVDSSPLLQGSGEVPVIKEGVVAGSRSWMQDAWNRIGVAAEDAVSGMGDFGRQLANGIRTVRDVPAVRYGEFSAEFDDFFKGMSKKQARKVTTLLADALEGRAKGRGLPKGLLEFVQQKLRVIADEAAGVKLEVRNQVGETLPFAPRENYFPRMLRPEIFDKLIAGDNKVMREMAERMVANRQAPSYPIAFERVKFMRNKLGSQKYGHLERAREMDLPPEYYDRNAMRVIPEYMNSALHRIEEVRQFGLEGERALEMIKGIAETGFDDKLARTIFERFTRIEPRDQVYLRGAQGLRNLAAGMLIQAQSTALQLGQAMMPAYEAGFIRAVKGFAKTFTSLGEAEAKRAGQVFTTAATDYMKEAYGGGYGFAGKFADKMMSMTGFARMDHFFRKYSSLVGKDYIPSLVNKLLRNHGDKTALVELQHLGYDTNKIIAQKGLSDLELNVGAKRFADMTQGAPDVTRLPEFWTTWQGKLMFQFKNFSYVIGKQNASLIKRGFQTGNFTRLGEMAIGLPATGYVIKTIRDAMVGENDVEITGDEDIDIAIQVLANATAFGPAVDLFFLAMQGGDRLTSFVTPIALKNVFEVAGAIGTSIRAQDLEPLFKTATKKIPLLGRVLAHQMEE